MKQEIIRLDQLTMGTIKYSDITLIQEKETEIISSDSLWRGIHEYYNGLLFMEGLWRNGEIKVKFF